RSCRSHWTCGRGSAKVVEIDCLSFVEAVWHSSEEVVETLENLPPNKALLLHRKKNRCSTRKGKKNESALAWN
ncbi:hypothetical protein KJQ97_09425, partial [Campylobacter sp. 2018MI01]|uniref:hypothetical protein n=1 Tax=Campylobacter sp. 2018MI01 TaxID=2836735 RepID=UPI001BDA4904